MSSIQSRYQLGRDILGLPENNAVSAFQQGLVAAFRQPACTFEVAFEGLTGTVGFLFGVYPQNITGHLMVILAFASGIQEGEIDCEMRPVVRRNGVRLGRFNCHFQHL